MKIIFILTILIISCLKMQAGIYILIIDPPTEDTSEVAKARALHNKVVEEERIIRTVDEIIAVTLPQGISKTIGNQENIIVIETMKFTPKGHQLTAWMTSDIPKSEQKIALKGKDINFAPGGFTGGARLELIEDLNIPLGKNMTMVLKTDERKTFVDCDCKGYKEMGLQGEIQFNRDKLIPENPAGDIIEDENVKVKAPFEIKVVGWDDLLLEVGVTPFRVKGMKDFSFKVNKAVFDFSEQENSPGMVFPEGYESSDFLDGNRNLWKGFYLKDFIVRLPDELNKKDGTRSTIEAHDLLIDNQGVSGKFLATEVFSRDEAEMNRWEYSLDTISAELMKNQMVSCGFTGELNIPIMGESTVLGYKAFIDAGDQYNFNVITGDTINMDVWAAKLRLDPNSTVDITVIEDQFKPTAILNGRLAIGTKKIELANVNFQELTIRHEAPHISVKAFSFGSEYGQQKLGKFPISITNIGLRSENERVGLDFDLNVNLVKPNAGGFAGSSGLSVFAKSYEENNKQKWAYDGFEVRRIAIKIDGGSYKVEGSAHWFKEDAIYGNGFNGRLMAEFSMLPKLEASALFGNINGMRYFYVDALADLPTGMPLFAGIKLYGFGGGLYHHMSPLKWDEKPQGTIGQTSSGIVYQPDKTSFLGLKSTVKLGAAKKTMFNGDLSFEMIFNNRAGVNRIMFNGNGYFMTPKEDANIGLSVLQDKCKDIAKGEDPNVIGNKDTNPAKSSIYAYVNLDMDFQNGVLHGILASYINVGNGLLTGTGPGGSAGQMVMHYEKDDWYIHIGTPTRKIGLSVANFANINSYFMMGTQIPASPPPPAKVSEILGGINLDYMANENALGIGKGIAFGADLQFNTGHKNFKPFYATFDAGAGFDVMLKNYGNVTCKGLSNPLGINGWYANGQVWAYLEGAIGIDVKLKFIKGKYEILKVGAAAILQAKLPNPLWMRGIVGGRYSILGGLVSGNCRFEFTMGKECEITGGGSPVSGVEVISELTPGNGATDVNVFNAAQAVFNMPIGKKFELEDLNGKNIAFKIVLDHFMVKDGNAEIPGEFKWNPEKDVLAFDSYDVLPPQKQLTLEVQVSFKELKNGIWQVVTEDGNKITEKMSVSFTTGEAPKYIPISNVAYSYPMPMMFNYYQDESNLGYIQLKDGQDYLFEVEPEWMQVGQFVDVAGKKHRFNFTYNTSQNRIEFIRPTGLINNELYSFELVNIPAGTQVKIDENVSDIVQSKDLNLDEQTADNESTVEIKTQDAEGTIELLEETNIFKTHFRTSLYNTVSSKLSNMVHSSYLRWYLSPGVHNIYVYNNGDELFSEMEKNGADGIEPLVQFKDKLDSRWYKRLISPLVYYQYPFDNIELEWRAPLEALGIPPTKAISVFQYPAPPSLTSDQLETGIINPAPSWVGFKYKQPYYMNKDYRELKDKAANKYYSISPVPIRVRYLLENSFRAIYKGDYNVELKYILPGINQQSSTQNVKFVSPVGL